MYDDFTRPALTDFLSVDLRTEERWGPTTHALGNCQYVQALCGVGSNKDSYSPRDICGEMEVGEDRNFWRLTRPSPVTPLGVVYGHEGATTLDYGGELLKVNFTFDPALPPPSQRIDAFAAYVQGIVSGACETTGVRVYPMLDGSNNWSADITADMQVQYVDTNGYQNRSAIYNELRAMGRSAIGEVMGRVGTQGWRFLKPIGVTDVFPLLNNVPGGFYTICGPFGVSLDTRPWVRRTENYECRWVKIIKQDDLRPLNTANPVPDPSVPYHGIGGGTGTNLFHVKPKIRNVPVGWTLLYYVETLDGVPPTTSTQMLTWLGVDHSLRGWGAGILSSSASSIQWVGGEKTYPYPSYANHPFRLKVYVLPPGFPTTGNTSISQVIERGAVHAITAELYPFSVTGPPSDFFTAPTPKRLELMWTQHPKRRGNAKITAAEHIEAHDPRFSQDFRTWQRIRRYSLPR